ncbi:MAG: two-component system response regulator [Desulfobacteraceae bacterium]|nr:MAG: two-component system response regulator [Desulfobacteraceae bacterium]
MMSARRILIVDDSAVFRMSMKKMLASMNAEIILAEDGQEGLDLALQEKFDIVVSDIDMPKINGIELCRCLKNTASTQGTPVVMVSTFDSDSDVDKGFQAGASAYLSKYEIQNRLLETVESVLSKSKFKSDRLVMVVDDSKVVLQIVEKGLAEAGFRIITAENGKKALKLLETIQPDLILSDIEMPDINGFDLCQTVHTNPDLSSIPIIAMRSITDRGYMRRMLQNGASAYICKPFNIDELVILVEKLLSDQFHMLIMERERLDSERNLMIASITSLIAALEARDNYTKGHSEAVGLIVSGMLRISGASKIEIETVTIGGRLHDIGKIGVRDEILLKPGRLTDEEFAHIKKHPDIGANIIRSIPSFSDVIPIVLSHHERLDGKGYPQGLKGDKIHLWARMAAVADTYHSLTSDRPYRKGMAQGKALQIIEDVSGTQLCPDCVSLFFKWLAQKEK